MFCFPTDLGVIASQRIISSKSPLEALEHISQNFPMLAPAQSKEAKNLSLFKEIVYNQENFLAEGKSSISINGLQLNLERLNPFK